MKMKFTSLILSLSIFYSCQKEADVLSVSSTSGEEVSSSAITFIYHDQIIERNQIDYSNSELVMFVAENNLVYVFDNNDEFLNWSEATPFSDDIKQLENKRQEILAYEQLHGAVEQGNSEDVAFMESIQKSSTDKTDLLCYIYENSNASYVGDKKLIVIGWPYSSLGSMDNKASSISGASVVTACYNNTGFSGSRVYISTFGATINFADLNFDNMTSSVISI